MTWKILLYNRNYCIYTKAKLIWEMSLTFWIQCSCSKWPPSASKHCHNLLQRYWWVKSVYIFLGHSVYIYIYIYLFIYLFMLWNAAALRLSCESCTASVFPYRMNANVNRCTKCDMCSLNAETDFHEVGIYLE